MTGPYTDHHVHLLSTIAARLSVDVSAAADIDALAHVIRSEQRRERGAWTRAWGYEEWALAERRHPTRDDLDRAVAGRPVVLHHRSGHAAVLNSAALEEIGAAGHPDGILFDRHELLARVPRLPAPALRSAAEEVSRAWSALGVSAVVDATHTNGPAELETLAEWVAGGVITQRVTAMVSLGAVGSVPPFGRRVGGVGVGWVKLMPLPDRLGDVGASVASSVGAAHDAGYPVAVHVVDIDVLDATLDALERSAPPAGLVDRIEHNALCLPEQVERIAACRAMVVVNPGFLVHRRPKYERELTAVERPWLVRIGSLIRAGVDVRAGSDSPVTPSVPEEMIAAAVQHPFSPHESVSAEVAGGLLAP